MRSAFLSILLLLLHSQPLAGEEQKIDLALLEGKPCTFGKGGEQGFLAVSGTSFVLPDPLPPGAYLVRLHVRYNRKGGAFQLGTLAAGGTAWPPGLDEDEATEAGKTTRLSGSGAAIAEIPVDSSAPVISVHIPPADSPRRVRIALSISFSNEARKAYDEERLKKLVKTGAPSAEADPGGIDEEDGDVADEFEVRTVDVTKIDYGAIGITRAALVTQLKSVCIEDLVTDRILYDPGMKGTVSARLWNFSERPAKSVLALLLAKGVHDQEEVARVELTLGAKERRTLEFPIAVGEEEMGRGVVATLQTGEELATRRFAFSVARDAYRVGFHGQGVPMFVPLWWDREQCLKEADALARSNVRNYVNVWEAFAWAPSDFDEMTPAEEVWASGQTQYRKTKTCIKAYLETFKKYGIRSITYGKSCGGGYEGLALALKRPQIYHTFGPSGFCHEFFSVDVLDRMREGRYCIHGLDEDFWQEWISVWAAIGNREGYELGCDEIIASAKMFGWDGVRYDGHFNYWRDDVKSGQIVRYCEERIRKELPGFSIGYNYVNSAEDRVAYRTSEEFKAAAANGGLMMNEVYRNHVGDVSANLNFVQGSADEVRRAGGYYLCIYDVGGDINGALCLAGGARPMGSTSRPLREFATRYSAYILDETNRRLEQPQKVFSADPKTNFIWDRFIYEKEEAPGRCSLILQLVNVNPKLDFGGRHGPIRNLNAAQHDFTFKVSLPGACRIGSVFATGVRDGWQSQAVRWEGESITIPYIGLWTMVVLDVEKPGDFSFAKYCELPLSESERATIDVGVKQKLKLAPPTDGAPTAEKEIKSGRWREAREYRDRDHLDAVSKTVPQTPELLRNGRLDVLHLKGAFYHLHRLDGALASFADASVLEALVENGGTSQRLSEKNGDRILPVYPWDTWLRQDVIVLDNVAASAMSLKERLKIARFVEAGGGLLLIGGWYTLDKGEFEGSLVEDFLPCETLQHHSLVRLDAAAPLSPGPDKLPGLDLSSLDFRERPYAKWVNNVLPRPGARTLMKVGDAPAVLASTHGKGRVVVLPLATSGQFPPGKLPYWEWSGWPRLLEECVRYLGTGCQEEVEEPSLVSDEDVETILFELDEMGEKDAVKALNRLRLHRRASSAREIARYVAEHEGMDPELVENLLDYALPYADETWLDIGKRMLQRMEQSMIRAGVTILLEGTEKPDLKELEPILKRLSIVDRAKLYARSVDPRHLPWLQSELAKAIEREEWCARERVSEKPSPHLMLDQGLPRLHHPFLAGAAFRCGDTGAAYEYARGVYLLFFYAWRERWIVESQSKTDWSDTPEMAIRKQRARVRGYKRLAMFRQEAENALDMLLEDLDRMEPAALRAMKEIDCHRAMPGVYRIFARLKPEDWAAVAPLIQTRYEPVRNTSLQFVLRHGGNEGQTQVSAALLKLADGGSAADVVYVLKHHTLLEPEQRLRLVMGALKEGGTEAYEAALRAAFLLPAQEKEQALKQAAERQDFFARRIRQSYGLAEDSTHR